MNDYERALVLSLRPRFAHSILDGSKSVELRRQRVATSPGTPVVLYASAPVMAVVGTARVAEVHIDEPDCVWQQFHMDLGLKREEFEQYVAGAAQASALLLTDIDRLWAPVSLSHLRQAQPFNPPQSYAISLVIRWSDWSKATPLRASFSAAWQADELTGWGPALE